MAGGEEGRGEGEEGKRGICHLAPVSNVHVLVIIRREEAPL